MAEKTTFYENLIRKENLKDMLKERSCEKQQNMSLVKEYAEQYPLEATKNKLDLSELLKKDLKYRTKIEIEREATKRFLLLFPKMRHLPFFGFINSRSKLMKEEEILEILARNNLISEKSNSEDIFNNLLSKSFHAHSMFFSGYQLTKLNDLSSEELYCFEGYSLDIC